VKLPVRLDMNAARVIAGGGSFALSVAVLALLVSQPALANNDPLQSPAQAIVIQGLIGLVMAFLFTGNHGPRKDAPDDEDR